MIPGHRYLFKVSKDWRILQHWSEVIAFSLAQLCGIAAAPCFVAIDSHAEEVGVLVEFFYGYPHVPVVPRFVAGADLLRNLVEGYEADPDRHHTIGNVLLLSRVMRTDDRVAKWGRLLTFDALIGNTDRHPENWGFLAERHQEVWRFELARSFDHGTSLAYQVRNDDITRKWSREEIRNHAVQRGRHHSRWSSENPERRHVELCRMFAQAYPQAVPRMKGVLDFRSIRWMKS